jgi:hypothetical protein
MLMLRKRKAGQKQTPPQLVMVMLMLRNRKAGQKQTLPHLVMVMLMLRKRKAGQKQTPPQLLLPRLKHFLPLLQVGLKRKCLFSFARKFLTFTTFFAKII